MRNRVRFRVFTSLTSIPARVTPHCRVNKRRPALHMPEDGGGRATSLQHCPRSQDGLSPGAIIQQCTVYQSRSSSIYVNGYGGSGPSPLFKLWSGVGVCTALLCNSIVSFLIDSEWELKSR